MKSIVLKFIAILITVTAFAQNAINYKAVIKDVNGDLVSNQAITIQFAIKEGVAMTTIYEESHNPTTDANGLAIVNIGQGVPISGAFNMVAWGSDEHHLKVQVDIGAGLIDMGTTQFMAVPYAKQAEKVDDMAFKIDNGVIQGINVTDDFVVGSTQLDNISGSADDNRMFFDKSLGAFRAGNGSGANWNESIIGINSFAGGNNSEASGDYSFAFGDYTEAGGFYSFAMGTNTVSNGTGAVAFGNYSSASGNYSLAVGSNTVAIGNYSFAMGNLNSASGNSSVSFGTTQANVAYSLAIGKHNVGIGDANSWVDDDPLFEAGIGAGFGSRKNAFTILKNGKTGINTATPSSLLEVAHPNGLPSPADLTNAFSIKNLGSGPGTDHSWQMYTVSDGYLAFYKDGAYRGVFNAVTGAYGSVSDVRLKSNIKDLDAGMLHKVMNLRPVSYQMNDQKDDKNHIGLIAQEVQKEFSAVVNTATDVNKTLTVNYGELIPVLIKSIQEQQTTIDALRARIEKLENK